MCVFIIDDNKNNKTKKFSFSCLATKLNGSNKQSILSKEGNSEIDRE